MPLSLQAAAAPPAEDNNNNDEQQQLAVGASGRARPAAAPADPAERLGSDIFDRVLAHLTAYEALAAAGVCRAWRAAVRRVQTRRHVIGSAAARQQPHAAAAGGAEGRAQPTQPQQRRRRGIGEW